MNRMADEIHERCSVNLAKRKKKVLKCPNPLFVYWLKEAKDEAASKGLKTQYVYSRALQSLRKYPLSLPSGKSCKIIENVGDKICKFLDDKLDEHEKLYGSKEFVPDEILSSIPGEKPRKRKHPASVASKTSKQPQAEDGNMPIDCMQRIQSQGTGKGHKQYLPRYGSGAYALLVTLLKVSDGDGSMLKQQLIQSAQPFAENSFTVPPAGSRYTAWSSMGSLIKKALVLKRSSPARYSLTSAGIQLAKQLQEQGESLHNTDTITTASVDLSVLSSEETHFRRPHDQHLEPASQWIDHVPHSSFESLVTSHPSFEAPSSRGSVAEKYNSAASGSFSSKDNFQTLDCPTSGALLTDTAFEFSYVGEDGKRVRKKDAAAVLIDEDVGGLGFLVECDYECLLLSGKSYTFHPDRFSSEGRVFAYLADRDAPETSTCPVRDEIFPAVFSTPDATSSLPHLSASQRKFQSDMQPTVSKCKHSVGMEVQNSDILVVEHRETHAISPRNEDAAHQKVTTLKEQPIFTLRAGTFDVILCVDKREHFGSANSSKKFLLPELQKHQTKFELRNLQVGDFVWIARKKHAIESDQDIVFDHVVERKRLDDLASSIVDGRFQEQKLRLRQCGLRHGIYLVEDCGSSQHFALPEESLYQSIVNTQIVDGFYVKRTHDLKESVAYLTLMTRYLENLYANKNLIACRRACREEMVAQNNENLQYQFLTFSEFSEGSVKRKAETISDLFLRQLMQIQRLTVEKASAIVELYSTPSRLMEAYKQCMSDKEGQHLLAEKQYNANGSKIGALLSKQVYFLFTRMSTSDSTEGI